MELEKLADDFDVERENVAIEYRWADGLIDKNAIFTGG